MKRKVSHSVSGQGESAEAVEQRIKQAKTESLRQVREKELYSKVIRDHYHQFERQAYGKLVGQYLLRAFGLMGKQGRAVQYQKNLLNKEIQGAINSLSQAQRQTEHAKQLYPSFFTSATLDSPLQQYRHAQSLLQDLKQFLLLADRLSVDDINLMSRFQKTFLSSLERVSVAYSVVVKKLDQHCDDKSLTLPELHVCENDLYKIVKPARSALDDANSVLKLLEEKFSDRDLTQLVRYFTSSKELARDMTASISDDLLYIMEEQAIAEMGDELAPGHVVILDEETRLSCYK